jgi:hypothetical protein
MRQPLLVAIALGTVLQLIMVLWGHSDPAVAALFAVGGMGISLLAGLVYALMARGGLGSGAFGGAIAGAACGLIGITVSLALGDVEPLLLALGTASSALTGAAGGLLGALFARRPLKA